ncbi:MAG: tetratricopeptide repeat protein [PVC group bacterium]
MTKKKIVILSLVLGITALTFLPSLFLGFNPFWDLFYVHRNPFQRPLTFRLAQEAFGFFLEGNYHPLTLLGHSFDFTLWGDNPFGHHLTSYLIHLGNVALVFFLVECLLRAGTDRSRNALAYIAGLTALIFGIHPLRVESVAWITERKDVLFAFFYLLTLCFFAGWHQKRRKGLYGVAVLAYLGAVLSKAMAVSLPLVAFILDYRLLSPPGTKSWRISLYRVIPFAALAGMATVLAILGQQRESLMAPLDLPLFLRNLFQFPGVLLFYLGRTLCPFGLAPIYPNELLAVPGYCLLSWLLLTGTVTFCWIGRKRRPSLITVFLVYIAVLIPVGGLIRVGAQVLADRFSYISSIPLNFLLGWLIVTAISRSPRFKMIIIGVTGIWMAILGRVTVSYTVLWDDPIALTRRAYDRYPRAKIIEIFMLRTYNNAAIKKIEKGEVDCAIEYVRQALQIKPDFMDSYLIWSIALARKGEYDSEFQAFQGCVEKCIFSLIKKGDYHRASQVYQEALKITQGLSKAYLNQGVLLANQGALEEAEAMFRQALEYWKNSPEAYYNLALIYEKQGELNKAVDALNKAHAILPENRQVRDRLAILLKRLKEISEIKRSE